MSRWWKQLNVGRPSTRDVSGPTDGRVGAQAMAGGSALNVKSGHGTAGLVALHGLATGHSSPRTYRAFAREGMMQNAVVYRCVRLIAEAAASIPLRTMDPAGASEDGNRDCEDLRRLLASPAPGTTGTDLMETWYGYLLVSGNAYLRAVVINNEVRGLHVLRPDRMQVLAGTDGWVSGYEYTVDGRQMRYLGDALPGMAPVLHMKLFHPDNDHYGLSPLEAAATAIDIHNSASRWNKALLDNAARPSGALVYSASEHMTQDQFARLKDELETNFQGARNAGRPLLLEGGLDWKAMSMSPRDMDFIAAKNAAAREIALALGVPPMLLGIPGDNTYSNYQEANRTFWRQTVLPLVNRTARAVGTWLSPAFCEAGPLHPELERIDALSSERDAMWRRLNDVTFLTDAEKREAVGYPAERPPTTSTVAV